MNHFSEVDSFNITTKYFHFIIIKNLFFIIAMINEANYHSYFRRLFLFICQIKHNQQYNINHHLVNIYNRRK